MSVDGWILIALISTAVAYCFGVDLKQPVRARARRERPAGR